MNETNKSSWYARIGAMGGRVKSKSKGFGSDPRRAAWAGKMSGLAKRLGRKPNPAEVEELRRKLDKTL